MQNIPARQPDKKSLQFADKISQQNYNIKRHLQHGTTEGSDHFNMLAAISKSGKISSHAIGGTPMTEFTRVEPTSDQPLSSDPNEQSSPDFRKKASDREMEKQLIPKIEVEETPIFEKQDYDTMEKEFELSEYDY